jgi:RNA polymerase sigma-70 factor, ECF subfamily
MLAEIEKSQEQTPIRLLDFADSFFRNFWNCKSAILPRTGIPPNLRQVTSTMPRQDVALTKTKCRSAAAHGDRYLDCESALNYETALLECASGSQSAVGKIYALEKVQLRVVALRIVHDMSRAEDVIHEAFVQILRDSKNFDPTRGSARGWIYAIVRNTALKTRASARRELALGGDTLDAIGERERANLNPASCIADSMALRTMLDRLEPRRRASLLLAIIDGRTHEEIAKYLRVPVGTVKAWIRRELVAMRRQLE